MFVWQIIVGVLIGLGFGYVMQRSQICYNRAHRTLTIQSENTMFRAVALAMVIQMVCWHVFVALGVVHVNIVPASGWRRWLAAFSSGCHLCSRRDARRQYGTVSATVISG